MVFVACGAVLLATAAKAERIGDIDVLVQPLPDVQTTGRSNGTVHGYVEYRVQLRNSSAKDHTVELMYPRPGDFDLGSGVMATRTVQVLAGQGASVSLFEPPSGGGYGEMRVRVDDVKDPVKISVGNLRVQRYFRGTPLPAVLLSRGIPQDFRDRARRIEEEAKKAAEKTKPPAPATPSPGTPGVVITYGSSGEESVPDRLLFLRSEVAVSQWSPNWLGYSCFDAIFLTQQEAEQMPAPVQTAVRRYVECGGTLWVHGREVPEAFTQGGTADPKGGYHVGLGRAVAIGDRGEPNWDAIYRQIAAAPPPIYLPQERPTTLHDLLVAETTVPVRGLFFLVLVFSVAIGPVNVWVLSKYRRRIWLWWNVPAISLLTCLTVFGYSLFSEGWTARGKTASLTLLDERSHRATTIGLVSLYCPLTPSRGLHFGMDTDVAELVRRDPSVIYSPFGEDRRRGPRFVDWTVDQHLVSGWVTARVPVYFQFRKSEDRRERLSVEKKADGSLSVVNALGADIRRLWVADASGRVFEGRDIPAGAERTLTPAAGSRMASVSVQAELRNLFTGSDWLGALDGWNSGSPAGANKLSPGGYIAFLTKSPFVDTPLPGADCEDSVAIVCGISKGQDNGR